MEDWKKKKKKKKKKIIVIPRKKNKKGYLSKFVYGVNFIINISKGFLRK